MNTNLNLLMVIKVFDLMDTTHDKAIIQVIGLGKKIQSLCSYIESQGIEGITCFFGNENDVLKTNPIVLSSNLALSFSVDWGINNKLIETPDLNFYLVDGSELSEYIDQIQQYSKKTCVNCLVIVNYYLAVKNDLEKINNLTKQMDSFLPLPNSPFDDNKISFLINQNKIAYGFIQCISEMITRPGLICIDFSDVRTVVMKMNKTVFGIFSSSGNNRIINVLKQIRSYQAFQNNTLLQTRAILVNIKAGLNLSFKDYEDVQFFFHQHCNDEASIMIGTVIEPDLKEEIGVSVLLGSDISSVCQN